MPTLGNLATLGLFGFQQLFWPVKEGSQPCEGKEVPIHSYAYSPDGETYYNDYPRLPLYGFLDRSSWGLQVGDTVLGSVTYAQGSIMIQSERDATSQGGPIEAQKTVYPDSAIVEIYHIDPILDPDDDGKWTIRLRTWWVIKDQPGSLCAETDQTGQTTYFWKGKEKK